MWGAWLVVFMIGGGLSLGYWYLIRRGLVALAETAADHQVSNVTPSTASTEPQLHQVISPPDTRPPATGSSDFSKSAGQVATPTTKTREQLISELNSLIEKHEWDSLAKRLNGIDGDPARRDINLYFRGLLYSHSKPAPDPERYLSQVPQESELFLNAQQARFFNYTQAPEEKVAVAIIDSLDRAGVRNSIYFALFLAIHPKLSYGEISSLYDDFARHNRELFNFGEMKSELRGTQGVYMEAFLPDVLQIPACVLLFQFRRLQAARSECIDAHSVLASHDALLANVADSDLTSSMWMLHVDPNIKGMFEELRKRIPPAECKPQ
jgi:hypothetical protein